MKVIVWKDDGFGGYDMHMLEFFFGEDDYIYYMYVGTSGVHDTGLMQMNDYTNDIKEFCNIKPFKLVTVVKE